MQGDRFQGGARQHATAPQHPMQGGKGGFAGAPGQMPMASGAPPQAQGAPGQFPGAGQPPAHPHAKAPPAGGYPQSAHAPQGAPGQGAPGFYPSSSPRRGFVKRWNFEKGYGFIQPAEGGEDVFVHHSVIHAQGFRSLSEGAVVEFEAVQVCGPGGALIQGAQRPQPLVGAVNGAHGSAMPYGVDGQRGPAQQYGAPSAQNYPMGGAVVPPHQATPFMQGAGGAYPGGFPGPGAPFMQGSPQGAQYGSPQGLPQSPVQYAGQHQRGGDPRFAAQGGSPMNNYHA